MKKSGFTALLLVFFAVLDAFVWFQVFAAGPNKNLELYFLDVGQGDSELALLPGGVKVLIDGGPDNKVLAELGSVLRPTDRYIDLVIMSHPQLDHFGGLIDVLKRYRVGLFIFDGKAGQTSAFEDLAKVIRENKIRAAALKEGDVIKYNGSVFDIVSPSAALLQSKEPNNWTLVMKLNSGGLKALYTGDIDAKVEESLAQKYDVRIDVLKVAHHGSKFSSSLNFLKAAMPKIAVIEVGAKNTYGHPTPQALTNLAQVGSQIFRTDRNGTIKLEVVESKINIFKQK